MIGKNYNVKYVKDNPSPDKETVLIYDENGDMRDEIIYEDFDMIFSIDDMENGDIIDLNDVKYVAKKFHRFLLLNKFKSQIGSISADLYEKLFTEDEKRNIETIGVDN